MGRTPLVGWALDIRKSEKFKGLPWHRSAFRNARQGRCDWQVMAEWIDRNLPYSSAWFFPTYWAFNIGWHERPQRRIDNYAEPKGLRNSVD